MEILHQIAEKISNNEFEAVLELIEKNAAILDDNSEFWNMKGVLCLKVGEFDAAINCLEKAVELNKNNADALYNLAYVFESIGDYDNALKKYKYLLLITDIEELRDDVHSCIDRIEAIREPCNDNYEIIIKNTDNKKTPQPGDNIYMARANVAEAMLNDDAPLVSIYVLAYNNLEKHTKTCVECILKYTTDVNYELILVDNGSTDGTLEYFKLVEHPRKKIIRITKNIGPNYGTNMGFSYASGRYVVGIANDVYVTKNWLSNMLKCALSDDRIGMINPVSDYISNYQSVNLEYNDFQDMQRKAAEFNISDPRKWEERLRLITIGQMLKKECIDIIGLSDYGFFHDFVDDDLTFRVRRAGYKTILCKDVFVCHAGKITDKGVDTAAQSLEKGKKTFKAKHFGIDAWDDVNNFEVTMMSLVDINEKHLCKNPEILGIDVLCGTPILELKNRLRNAGIFEAKLSAFSSDAKYWLDLKTICKGKVQVDRPEYLLENFDGTMFDYIIMGNPLNLYRQPQKLLEDMLKLLKSDGQLIIKINNTYDIRTLLYITGNYTAVDDNVGHQISLEMLSEWLDRYGYFLKNISTEFHAIDDKTRNLLKGYIENAGFAKNAEYAFNRMITKDYIIKIVKKL